VTAVVDIDLEQVKRTILDAVDAARRRVTPAEIRRQLSREHGVAKEAASRAIRALTMENILVYTYQFGNTFLEPSFNRPVRIGSHFILKPPNLEYQPAPGDIIINIVSGAAFGSGEHPSTRLALRALSHAVERTPGLREARDPLLDMGTGSGVLAIAALRMGIRRAVGVDIDPCARGEAEANAKMNGMTDRMRVVDSLDGTPDRGFCMVCANLRPPTLKALKPLFTAGTRGPLVFSGIKADETVPLKALYGDAGYACTWEETERSWAGLVFSGIPCET
jgi:ribosomal protein L11 methyltransferase